jgi:IS30 family transposase
MSPALPRFGDKQKKTRLTNADRRKICVYSGDHPTARQEDIAAMWNVERSTISKILKAKAKWLATPIEDDAKTARHR